MIQYHQSRISLKLRFMKSLREKEQELLQLGGHLDRLQEEMLRLRNENLEIYRRLRILRVNSSGKQQKNFDEEG